MPSTTKLFLYKARDAPVAVLLRRGSRRTDWQIIRWDMTTNIFTPGQWLCGKSMNGTSQAISPCGRYLSYHCAVYPLSECYGVISSVSGVPKFTALLYKPNWPGEWETNRWTVDGAADLSSGGWEVRGDASSIPPVTYERAAVGYAESGFISLADGGVWVDPDGRRITAEADVLCADGRPLLDTSGHRFTEVA